MGEQVMLAIWLGIVIVTLIIEIITQGLTTIWFSIGAAVTAILCIWTPPIWVQLLVFCVVSVVVMLLARPFAKRMMTGSVTPTNIDRLLGEDAIVLSDIDNNKKKGQVSVRDLEWLARSEDGEIIPKGTTVTILRIEGVKLIVQQKNNFTKER